jgi:hypothetical protein
VTEVAQEVAFLYFSLMLFVSKQQLGSTLGKARFWFPTQLSGLEYIAGIPAMDAIRNPTAVLAAAPLRLVLLPRGLALRMSYRFEEHRFGLSYATIQEIAAELPQTLATSPPQSRWGRALLGGLVLGPVGALLGGMSGIPEREITEAGDAILLFRLALAGEEQVVAVTVRKKQRARTKRFLLTHYHQAAPATLLDLGAL